MTTSTTTTATRTVVLDVAVDLIDRDEANRDAVLDAAFVKSIALARRPAARARRTHRRWPLPADRR